MTLRVGLSAYDIAATDLIQLAIAADELGFESLWLGEHIVLPSDYGSEHQPRVTPPISTTPDRSASSPTPSCSIRSSPWPGAPASPARSNWRRGSSSSRCATRCSRRA